METKEHHSIFLLFLTLHVATSWSVLKRFASHLVFDNLKNFAEITSFRRFSNSNPGMSIHRNGKCFRYFLEIRSSQKVIS